VIGVDASVAAKWIFTEEHSDQARALLRTALSVPELIVAPPLLPIEVTRTVPEALDALLIRAARATHLETL
jgi:predicted nucleic acid-binding protein